MSFIGFLGSVAGDRSDVSEVPSPKRRIRLLEHAQKPNSRPPSEQWKPYKPASYKTLVIQTQNLNGF